MCRRFVNYQLSASTLHLQDGIAAQKQIGTMGSTRSFRLVIGEVEGHQVTKEKVAGRIGRENRKP